MQSIFFFFFAFWSLFSHLSFVLPLTLFSLSLRLVLSTFPYFGSPVFSLFLLFIYRRLNFGKEGSVFSADFSL